MENKEHQKQIIKLLSRDKNKYGLSLSDIKRKLELTKDQIRMSISFLLGSKELETTNFGMSKIFYIHRNKFMGNED